MSANDAKTDPEYRRMPRCLNLTRAGEYALAALSRLALLSPGGAPVSVDALAAAQGLPAPYLAKILRLCARAGLVRAKTGAAGGVALARRAEDVSLLEIVEACEGRYARGACVFYASRECAGPDCGVYCPLRRREEELRESMSGTTLAEMARALSVHPDARAAAA